MTLDLKPAKFIRLDLFPAQIMEMTDLKNPTLVSKDMRIIITDDMVYIFKEGNQGPMIHYASWLEEFTGSNKTGYIATTAAGETFQIARATNCGCGSSLRGFFPFPGTPFISQLK
jgi:hypothetical protein